jgi:hypothetical protein
MLDNARQFLSGFLTQSKQNITNLPKQNKSYQLFDIPSLGLRISHNQRQQSHAAVEAIAHLENMLAIVINST